MQVVFHDRENKHDSEMPVPGKLQNVCVLVRLPPVLFNRFCCMDRMSPGAPFTNII